jgi:phage terminase large subunit GpA-like protein
MIDTEFDVSLAKGFLDGVRPVQRITVDVWADTYRRLSSVASAEAGPWRTDRTPYLREIMSRLSANDPAETIVVMKGAQVGLTEAGNNWLGYIVHVSPAPTLMVMPTEAMVKKNSKTRIDPMIESSPILKERIQPARSRDSGNTLLQKEFPGGVLMLVGANSASGLRSMPVKNLFLDEVDAYPHDLDGEGSPISLAIARTRTFAKKKIFMISTPTVDGVSTIQNEFFETDQRHFFVPCPHCAAIQHLVFEQIKWEKSKPEEAKYECIHCNELIEERYKPRMLASGTWEAVAPKNATKKKVGYHINSLYSPLGWYSWSDAAKDYDNALNDVNKMKSFVNTVQGLTYKELGDRPQWEDLYNKREIYELNRPNREVAFITAGVDVQIDRIELEIVGWGSGKRSWSIDYRVLDGDTAKKEVWQKLQEILRETFVTEDNRELKISKMAVDAGFNTSHVYNFCVHQDSSLVFPIKGQDKATIMVSAPRPVVINSVGKAIGSVKVWNVAVSMIKSELYGWLKMNKEEDGSVPHGYCHFPQYDHFHFKSLTSEEVQIVKDKKGFDKHEWVKIFKRNERLDCRVYARAAAYVFGLDRMIDSDFTFLINQNHQKEEADDEDIEDFWKGR